MNIRSTRRAALREATDHMHRALDACVTGYDLQDGAGYGAFLEASAAPLTAVEALLEAGGVSELLEDWPERRRSPLIASDLAQLGRGFKPLQLRRGTPARSELIGMLYVLEGSRLGARQLHQQIAATGSMRAGAGAYLGAHDPVLWQRFLDLLESPEHAVDTHAMIGGAIFTFALFQRSFERHLPAGVLAEDS